MARPPRVSEHTLSREDGTSLHARLLPFQPGSPASPSNLRGLEAPRRRSSQIYLLHLRFPPNWHLIGSEKYSDGCMDEWLREPAIILCVVRARSASLSAYFPLAPVTRCSTSSVELTPTDSSFHFRRLHPECQP